MFNSNFFLGLIEIFICFPPSIQLHHSGNLAMQMLTMLEVIYAFGAVFIACELGQRTNLIFAECSDMVDQLRWYLFPVELQRMLPMILSYTQRPIEVKCFGSKTCDREAFKYVIAITALKTNPFLCNSELHIFYR